MKVERLQQRMRNSVAMPVAAMMLSRYGGLDQQSHCQDASAEFCRHRDFAVAIRNVNHGQSEEGGGCRH